jgi:hypothetical protein
MVGDIRPRTKPDVRLRVEHWRGGRLVGAEEKESDLVLDTGLDYLCAAVGQSGAGRPPTMSYTAVGTNATAASSNQSGLLAEVMRVANTYSKGPNTGEASLNATFSISASGYSLNEAGLVNTSGVGSSGIFYCRDVFSTTRNVISGDQVFVYYTLSFTRP